MDNSERASEHGLAATLVMIAMHRARHLLDLPLATHHTSRLLEQQLSKFHALASVKKVDIGLNLAVWLLVMYIYECNDPAVLYRLTPLHTTSLTTFFVFDFA